jgi:hypothetical protein
VIVLPFATLSATIRAGPPAVKGTAGSVDRARPCSLSPVPPLRPEPSPAQFTPNCADLGCKQPQETKTRAAEIIVRPTNGDGRLRSHDQASDRPRWTCWVPADCLLPGPSTRSCPRWGTGQRRWNPSRFSGRLPKRATMNSFSSRSRSTISTSRLSDELGADWNGASTPPAQSERSDCKTVRNGLTQVGHFIRSVDVCRQRTKGRGRRQCCWLPDCSLVARVRRSTRLGSGLYYSIPRTTVATASLHIAWVTLGTSWPSAAQQLAAADEARHR